MQILAVYGTLGQPFVSVREYFGGVPGRQDVLSSEFLFDNSDPVVVVFGVPTEVVHHQLGVLQVWGLSVRGGRKWIDQLMDVGENLVQEVHADVRQPGLAHFGQKLDGVVFQFEYYPIVITKPADHFGDPDQERLSPPKRKHRKSVLSRGFQNSQILT